jgi:hypothetical protein
MSEAILVRFSQEELAYLLRALKIKTLSGLEEHLLGNLDEDHQALALAVADRTLRARGSIRWESSQQRQVDAIVVGILQDCAHPHYTLLVDVLEKNKLYLRTLFTFNEQTVIEHAIPEPDIHEFVLFPSRVEVLNRLHQLLTIQEWEGLRGAAENLSLEQLDNVRKFALDDLEKASVILSEHLSVSTVKNLAEHLSSEIRMQRLSLWVGKPDQFENNKPESVLNIIQGKAGIFLFWEEKAESSQVEIIPASTQEAWNYVNRLLEPALNALPDLNENPG